MILPGETAVGSAGMQPCRRIAWCDHRNDHCICANILLALLPTRIGSVEPHALKTTARRTESRPPESLQQFTLRRHICSLARGLLRIAALGARNVKTASWKKVLKFARSRLSETTYRASAALRRSRLTCLLPWQLRIPKASVSQCR